MSAPSYMSNSQTTWYQEFGDYYPQAEMPAIPEGWQDISNGCAKVARAAIARAT